VYRHTATPTAFQGSELRWNGAGWDLRLRDGAVYQFPISDGATRSQQAALTQVRDRQGNTLAFQRDTEGRLTKLTTPKGRWLAMTYDSQFRVTQASDNLGRVVSYTYDGSGRLTRVTDPEGGVTEYTYDGAHRMLTVKDARGIVYLTNEYNANDRVTKQTQADGTTYQFAYTVDAGGTITQTDVTDPRGTVRRVTFSATGYTLTDTRALGQPEAQTLAYTRQAGTNLIVAVTDALGRQTTYGYDGHGHVTSVTRLAGTAEAVTSTFGYEPCLLDTPSGYCRLASVTPVTGTTAGQVTFTYAGLTQTTMTDARGTQTVLAYNAAGQLVTVRDPLLNLTQLGYDGQGNLVTITDPALNQTTRTYDAAGRPLSVTDPRGRTTTVFYDRLNQVLATTDAAGGTTRVSYDANGNLLGLTDARGSTTSYSYNAMDRLVTRTDPLSHSESYGYDANGNVTQHTDRKGQVATYTYDRLNRRTGASYAADSSATTYTYDGGDRLTQVADSLGGTITRTYEGLDRLTSETTSLGTVAYQYDALGRRTRMTMPGLAATTYAWDLASRLIQITQGAQVATYEYDDANRRTKLTLPNGVSTEYAYDAASRLTALTYKNGSTTLGDLSYSYDATSSRVRVGGTWSRTGLPQPLATATYNAANQQVAFGGQTLTYDLNGSLTSDGALTYGWDARNRLASLGGAAAASVVYDGAGRRASKTIGGVTTAFHYDGLNPVGEVSGTGVVNTLTGLGVDEYLSRTDATGTTVLLTDALGSTVALSDASTAIVGEYAYEPFGVTTATGAGATSPFRYTSREGDDPTGLYYYRARHYHPGLQRFLSEDPLGFEGGDVNLYGYVGNSPLNFIDPLGLDKEKQRCGDLRNDYYSAQASVGPGGGAQFQLTLDRYGRLYFAAGGQVGKSPWLVGGGIVRGAIVSRDAPSEARLASFLSGGPAFNAGAGAVIGTNVVWSGNDVSVESGVMSPQAGGGYTYGWQLPLVIPRFDRGAGGCR